MARTFVESSIEVERDNDVIDVRVEAYVYYSVDKSYGEDADGNRGWSRTEVEDIVELAAYDDDDRVIILTVKEEEKACKAITEEFLNQ